MVAERDLFLPKHPELEKIPNLHVIKALQVSQSPCWIEDILKLQYNNEYSDSFLQGLFWFGLFLSPVLLYPLYPKNGGSQLIDL